MSPQVLNRSTKQKSFTTGVRGRNFSGNLSNAEYVHNTTVTQLSAKYPVRKVLMFLFLICAVLVSLVWMQLQIDKISLEISDLRQGKNELESTNQYLMRDINNKTSYDVVYPFVKENFGMDNFQGAAPVILEAPDELLINKHR